MIFSKYWRTTEESKYKRREEQQKGEADLMGVENKLM